MSHFQRLLDDEENATYCRGRKDDRELVPLAFATPAQIPCRPQRYTLAAADGSVSVEYVMILLLVAIGGIGALLVAASALTVLYDTQTTWIGIGVL